MPLYLKPPPTPSEQKIPSLTERNNADKDFQPIL